MASRGLGDLVEAALSRVGVTADGVESLLGRPCGCPERRDRLNALTAWARRVVSGKTERAKEHLADLLGWTTERVR